MGRETVTIATVKKVRDFLKAVKEPVSKLEVIIKAGVNFYSLELILKRFPELKEKIKMR